MGHVRGLHQGPARSGAAHDDRLAVGTSCGTRSGGAVRGVTHRAARGRADGAVKRQLEAERHGVVEVLDDLVPAVVDVLRLGCGLRPEDVTAVLPGRRAACLAPARGAGCTRADVGLLPGPRDRNRLACRVDVGVRTPYDPVAALLLSDGRLPAGGESPAELHDAAGVDLEGCDLAVALARGHLGDLVAVGDAVGGGRTGLSRRGRRDLLAACARLVEAVTLRASRSRAVVVRVLGARERGARDDHQKRPDHAGQDEELTHATHGALTVPFL